MNLSPNNDGSADHQVNLTADQKTYVKLTGEDSDSIYNEHQSWESA